MSDLVDRIRRAGSGAQPSWTPERAAANELAMLQLGARRKIRRRLVLAVSGLVTVGVAAALFLSRASVPVARSPVRYADGTTAAPLSEDAALEVTRTSAELVSSELVRGAYRFDVVHNAARTFRVRAGAVQVDVLGTQFAMTRTQDEHVRVEVTSGRVRVLSDGQQAELGAGEIGVFPRPASTTMTRALADDAGSADEVAPTTPVHAPVAATVNRGWVHLAQAGDYDAAYVALKQTKEAAHGPVELMLAADAARLSHHPQEALGSLGAVMEKYPRDPRAPLAAFTLGRVLLDDLGRPADAGAAFARARSLAPTGPIAEDALAREVEAWSRSGDPVRAQTRAEEYLARYPNGTRARSVRRFGGLE